MTAGPDIRPLDATADRAAVTALFDAAADYTLLATGKPPDASTVDDYFTGGPPGCDPAAGLRLGLWGTVGGTGDVPRLDGLAELSFGFPHLRAAYLGYMILAPSARGAGLGTQFLAQVESIARARGATDMFLAVLEVNTRGRAFWVRHGFAPTGVSRIDDDHGLARVIHRLSKPL